MERESSDAFPEATINLNEVAASLWEGKYWIVSFTLASLLAGAIFLLSPLGDQRESSIEIKPLLANDLKRYALLNKNGVVAIDDQALLKRFTDILSLRQTLAQAITKTNYIEKRETELENEFQRRIIQTANAIELFPSNIKENSINVRRFWSVHIKTRHPERARSMIELAFSITNERVRVAINNSISTWLDVFETTLKYGKQDVNTTRNNAIEDYNRGIGRRISFLQEQLQLAQSLDIKKNTLEVKNVGSNTAYIANISGDTPYYFRGYVAIKKEIEQLNDRERKENFISNLLEIDQKGRELDQDKTIERTKEAQISANLTQQNFLSVYYDVNTMKFKPTLNRLAALIFFGLFGMIFGTAGLLIRQNMRIVSNK